MKKKWMKRMVCCALTLLLLGCSGQGKAENTETYTDKANLKQAGLGAMQLLYDDSVWTYDEEQSTDSSIVFRGADDSLLGISCSREGYYQHPLDMINTSRQIYTTFPGYEEIKEPEKVQIQEESWYEWRYQYEEEGSIIKTLQRFYGKNYYAYTISYVAEEKAYESGQNEALKVMNAIVMNVPDNSEAEEKAKKFLTGEWDIGDSGYLVLEEDGTYAWYMDDSKDKNNMHRGTYGCDVENASAGFSEGEGIYFVLFPEALYVDGVESMTANAKYDYLVSLEQLSDGSYQMLNGSTLVLYYIKKK